MDSFYERGEGVGMMHETIESYVGAQDSPGSDAARSEQGVKNYRNAHNRAGNIDPRYTGTAGFRDVRGNIGGGKTRTTRIYHAKKNGKTTELGRRYWEAKNP